MVTFRCNDMTLALTPEALADVLVIVRSDAARGYILAQVDAATGRGHEEPIVLPVPTFDALLDAVAERERAMLGEEEVS